MGTEPNQVKWRGIRLAAGETALPIEGKSGGTPVPVSMDVDSIQDADNDTRVETEKNADEDKVRITTGGTERLLIDSAGVDVKTQKILNVVNPTAAQQAATKAYVDALPVDEIHDADDDTKVQTEESADEDIIRMDVAGVEAFKLNDDGILDLVKQSMVSVYLGSNQTISTNTVTKIELDTENFDIQNEFDPATNYRFTAGKAGKYRVSCRVKYNTTVADKSHRLHIKKNGTAVVEVFKQSSITNFLTVSISAIISLAANDYLDFWTEHFAGEDHLILLGTVATEVSINKVA